MPHVAPREQRVQSPLDTYTDKPKALRASPNKRTQKAHACAGIPLRPPKR